MTRVILPGGATRRTPASPGRLLPGAGLALLSLLVSLLAGCDYPTEAPILEHQWVVPAEETRFGVAELLPGDVSVAADSSAFLVDFDAVGFSTTLGDLCPACLLADGLTAPKPAFFGEFRSEVAFPPEVVSVTVLGGEVEVEVVNGLNFDPIRPAAGSYGTLSLTITDAEDGDILATLTVDGADTPFPPGSTLTRLLPLAPASVEGGLAVTVAVDSPLGDPVTIDTSLPVSATATPRSVEVSAVGAEVAGRQVTLDPVSLDVEGVEQDVADRVVEGAFVLESVNPFGVGGSISVAVTAPGMDPIQRTATLPPDPASTVRLALSGDEIRRFLGRSGVTLSGSVVVDPGAGTVTLLPGQELHLTGKLDVTLLIGG